MLTLSSAGPRVGSLIGFLCRSISSYAPYISDWRTSIAIQRLWIKHVHFLSFCRTFPAVDHVARINEPYCTYECVMSHIWMRHVAHINASFRLWTHCHGSRTEEIGLQIITTPKISNNFSREAPYISNTFSRESPKLHTSSHVSKRNPRHSKDLPGNWVNLQIRMFWVWSPSWGPHKLEAV